MFLNRLIVLLLLTANIVLGNESPVVISQGQLPNNQKSINLTQIKPEVLAKGFETIRFGEGVTLYQLVPAEANHGWTIEMFDLSVTVGPHYHKIQNHLLIVLEGQLEICCDGTKTFTLAPGQSIAIPSGTSHILKAKQDCVRLLAMDMPGLVFPIDSYEPEYCYKHRNPCVISFSDFFINCCTRLPQPFLQKLQEHKELDADHYHAKAQLPQGTIYTLVPGTATEDKWSVDVLEIESLVNFQPRATKLIAVLNGEMEVAVKNERYHLRPGQSVRIPPNLPYSLKSLEKTVRLLCLTFP